MPSVPQPRSVDRALRAQQQVLRDFVAIPGVHAVGVGYKRRGGELTDEVAVIVYVDEKIPEDQLQPSWRIPESVRIRGERASVRTDVVQRARAVNYPHLPDGSLAGRTRPVPGGRSIEGFNGGGTLGGWVWDTVNDEPVLLSNNHVLSGVIGADVFQPWGSTAAADKIADNVRTGTLDATIAAPTTEDHVVYDIEGVGPGVYETTTPTLGMAVEKSGATTEHTTGVIVAVNLNLGHNGSTSDFEVDPDAGVDRMAFYGDSGSLIVERNHPDGSGWKRVVGLLWGGVPSERNAYAHPIEDVFADLQLTTICSGVMGRLLDGFASRPEPDGFVREITLVEPRRERTPPPWPGRLPQPVTPGRVMAPEPPADLERLVRASMIDRLREIGRVPRPRGLARDVESAMRGTRRGARLAELVQTHRVPLARAGMNRSTRRVLQEAAAPFLAGSSSAREVLGKPVGPEHVERFRTALDHLADDDSLSELVAEARVLLDRLAGRSLAEALDRH